ncbi:MAG: DUF2007 domain-containing protein [Planctomycetales bacterium]
MSDSEPREVYSAADAQEAHLIKTILEEAGIEAHVVGDHLQNAIGYLPAGVISPRVWVNTVHWEQARKIIDEHLAQTQPVSPDPWQCTGCGETNESSFEICWKCQTARTK